MITQESLGLLKTLIRNRNSLSLNHSMIGFTLDEYEGTVGREKVLAYAKSTGDNNPSYYDSNGIAPPFFLSGFVYERLKEILTHRDLGLNIMRMVHGEQQMVWHKHVRIGQKIRVKVYIDNIHDTAAGEMLTVSARAFDKEGLALEALMGFLVRNRARHAVDSKRSAGSEPVREELFRIGMTTWEGQQLEYAAASGDNNFIHTNAVLARMAGLPRTILHGVCIMAMCCTALTRQLAADDLSRLKSIKGRFAGIVLPGQVLTLVGYRQVVPGEQHFSVYNGSGNAVMKNGFFTFS